MHVSELHGLGVGEPHHGRRMEAHPDREAFRQSLVGRLGGEVGRRRVMRRDPGRVPALAGEVLLEPAGNEAGPFEIGWMVTPDGAVVRRPGILASCFCPGAKTLRTSNRLC